MIHRIVDACARRPGVTLVAGVLAALVGFVAQRSLPRDVIPDLSDPQVVLIAEWMGHPASEVAGQVTQVLTRALEGVPRSTAVRGTSMSGMGYIAVVFSSESALRDGRAEMVRRIDALRPQLPSAVRIQVGPIASATGWVFQYALVPQKPIVMTPMVEAEMAGKGGPLRPLRKFQDEVLRPALSAIPGVAEVASVGGQPEEILVQTSSQQLQGAGQALSDVEAAVRGVLARHPNATLPELAQDPLLAQVAQVKAVPAMSSGMTGVDGRGQIVVGIVIAERDADPAAVIARVKKVIDRERTNIPDNGRLGVIYDRSELTTRIGRTLLRALAEEIAVVALVTLVFLLHVRSALIPMLTLPLVVLLTFLGMWVLGIPATVMSLGGIAIALGMAVDAEFVTLEACHRRLESEGMAEGRRGRIVTAAGSYAPAILTSLFIAALAFVPVFAFTGESGRLLRPLAATKTLVVLAGALVTLTIAPALRDRLLRRGTVVPELRNPLTRMLVRAYRPFVHFALERPALTLTTAVLAAASCLLILPRIGSEFLPRIDEGDLLYMPTTAPGLGPEEAVEELSEQERDIAAHPAVAAAYGKIGRADTATDPAPFSMAETIVRLKPRSEWPTKKHARWYSAWAPAPLRKTLGLVWPEETHLTSQELVEDLDRLIRRPGWTNAWTAPVRARNDMMATGVRTPLGIRIVATDSGRLDTLGAAVERAARDVPGTRSAVYEGIGGERRFTFTLDPEAVTRYHVDPSRARVVAGLVLTGGTVGQVGIRSVRITSAPSWIAEPPPADELLRTASVRAGGDGKGQPVPLGLLGWVGVEVVPATLHAERGELSGYVYVDLQEGTDLASYVSRARAEVGRALDQGATRLSSGERLEWTGQYQILLAGERRLWLIVPLVALTMLGLLFLQFRSLTEALIVLVSVPFALIGSFWTLYLLDYRLSAPVWVGLLSVVGLAMQTGVVMVVYIDEAFHRRLHDGKIRSRADIIAAHAEGTVRRLRPKLMTVVTMAAGLFPLLWSQGSGAEIMKRVAAPMVGGLATSAFLTLEVIPVLYTIWRTRQLAAAQRRGVPLEELAA